MMKVPMMACGDGTMRADSSFLGKVQAKTADYTIKETEPEGAYIFSNRGAAGAVTFSLPKPKSGRQVLVIKQTNQNVLIKATDGAKVAGSNANKVYKNTAAETAASCWLIADGTDWFAQVAGTWSVDNA